MAKVLEIPLPVHVEVVRETSCAVEMQTFKLECACGQELDAELIHCPGWDEPDVIVIQAHECKLLT